MTSNNSASPRYNCYRTPARRRPQLVSSKDAQHPLSNTHPPALYEVDVLPFPSQSQSHDARMAANDTIIDNDKEFFGKVAVVEHRSVKNPMRRGPYIRPVPSYQRYVPGFQMSPALGRPRDPSTQAHTIDGQSSSPPVSDDGDDGDVEDSDQSDNTGQHWHHSRDEDRRNNPHQSIRDRAISAIAADLNLKEGKGSALSCNNQDRATMPGGSGFVGTMDHARDYLQVDLDTDGVPSNQPITFNLRKKKLDLIGCHVKKATATRQADGIRKTLLPSKISSQEKVQRFLGILQDEVPTEGLPKVAPSPRNDSVCESSSATSTNVDDAQGKHIVVDQRPDELSGGLPYRADADEELIDTISFYNSSSDAGFSDNVDEQSNTEDEGHDSHSSEDIATEHQCPPGDYGCLRCSIFGSTTFSPCPPKRFPTSPTPNWLLQWYHSVIPSCPRLSLQEFVSSHADRKLAELIIDMERALQGLDENMEGIGRLIWKTENTSWKVLMTTRLKKLREMATEFKTWRERAGESLGEPKLALYLTGLVPNQSLLKHRILISERINSHERSSGELDASLRNPFTRDSVYPLQVSPKRRKTQPLRCNELQVADEYFIRKVIDARPRRPHKSNSALLSQGSPKRRRLGSSTPDLPIQQLLSDGPPFWEAVDEDLYKQNEFSDALKKLKDEENQERRKDSMMEY